jgi:hypothetical protein
MITSIRVDCIGQIEHTVKCGVKNPCKVSRKDPAREKRICMEANVNMNSYKQVVQTDRTQQRVKSRIL